MVQQENAGQHHGQSDSYLKSYTALLKFLFICLPLWLSFKFYAGPYHEFVRNYLACVVYILVWSLVIQIILPRAQERLLLISLLAVFSVIELTAWQVPSLFDGISLTVLNHQIIGGHYSLHKIPYYGVGAFIGFFILRACRIR